MSLIKCPECDESVSSNVKQCIHCGCVFRVCPECEAVLVGEEKYCPQCGFQFASQEKQPEAPVENQKTLTQWYELSKLTSPFITSNGFYLTLRFVSFALAAIALIMVVIWGNSDDSLSALAEYGTTFKLSTVLLILGALLWFVASTISFLGNPTINKNLEKLVSLNNLNLPALIEEEFKRGFEGTPGESAYETRLVAIVDSIRLLQYQNIFIRLKVRRNAWIETIGSLLFTVFCCIFAVLNVENYMQLKLLGGDFGFDQIEYIWMPITAVVSCAICNMFAPGDPTNPKKWIEENLPQHLDDYTYYIKERIKRFAEKRNNKNAFQ